MIVTTLANRLNLKQQTLSTVESCTGGGIAARCTDVPGSSAWFVGGVVTYSNDMKVRLGVEEQDILNHGAVSEAVVRQMAEQGRMFCSADWSIAVSGIAGPDGGTPDKPVGTVWFAWAGPQQTDTECKVFTGNRQQIRQQAVDFALQTLTDLLN